MASLLFHRERGMPGPRLPMRKIHDVLRLSAAGMSKRKIAASLGVSATAAGECLRRARRAGLTWPLPEGLTDEALELRLYPPAVAAKDQRPQPDWAEVHRELRRTSRRAYRNISRHKRRLIETAHFAPPISAGSEPAWRRFDWRELDGVAHAARRQHGRIPH